MVRFCEGHQRIDGRKFLPRPEKSGCAMLKIGVESGDQAVLDAMHKGIQITDIEKTLKAVHGAGIGTYVYLLFGTPSEDEESARRTLDFTAQHHRLITFLNLAIFNLPHHSPDSRLVEQRPFYGGDLSFYTDFVHPKGGTERRSGVFSKGNLPAIPQSAKSQSVSPLSSHRIMRHFFVISGHSEKTSHARIARHHKICTRFYGETGR
jgi:hypothetical protein